MDPKPGTMLAPEDQGMHRVVGGGDGSVLDVNGIKVRVSKHTVEKSLSYRLFIEQHYLKIVSEYMQRENRLVIRSMLPSHLDYDA